MAVQDLTKSFALAPKSPRRKAARLGAGAVALTVLLVGCDTQNIDRRDHANTGSSLSGETQVITQTGNDNQRVAQVSVPSGALAINQKLSVEPGFHTDTEEIHSEFSIGADNEIKPAGVATVVSSNIDSNLASPMTIALDLPVSGAGLLGLFVDRHFFVVFTVRDSVAKAWKRGIVPAASITIADNKLTFSTKLMGKYEVFQASKPIDPPKTERIVSEPELVAPPVTVTKVTPLVAQPDQVVTLRGKYFTDKTTVSIGNFKVGTVKVESSNLLTFHMPDIYGLKTITVAEATNTATAEVIGRSTKIDRPVIGLNPDQVCSGISYYDHEGNPHDGTRRCDYEICQNTGDKGCIATVDVPAIKKSTIPVDKILEGAGILGQMGTYVPPSQPDMPQDCAADNATGCVATTAFPAVNKANVAAINLREGTTIAGISGVLADCHLDGGTYCVAMPNFPAIDKSSIPTNSLRTSAYIAGVGGTLNDCSVDGEQGCVATSLFKAADMSIATEGNIKNGATVAGVVGKYPSANYTLAGAGASTYPLTSSNFATRVAETFSFEFWDATGNRQTATGSSMLLPENILDGISIFNVTGTVTPAPVVQAHDIRKGVVIGDVTGALKTDCRNSAKTGGYEDTTFGSFYSTVEEDHLPDIKTFGDNHQCAGEIWLDKTIVNDVLEPCTNITGNCMWQNTVTQAYWAGDSKSSARTWQDAATYCNNLNASGKSTGWRLPTQKELMVAYTHGIVAIAGTNSELKGSNQKYWSATTNSMASSERYAINLRTGIVESLPYGNTLGTVCVHD